MPALMTTRPYCCVSMASDTSVKVFTCASTGEPVHLRKQIASSGEGTVWQTNRSGFLAKLYHSPDRERAQKLAVMVAYPPVDPMLSRNHISLAWPKELLLDRGGKCVGFLMSAISQGVDLTSVYNPRLRKQKIPRFNWRYLHTTALNIAWIIQEIHAKGHVLGDIKPQNMLVNDQALVSVIDTDSFQIRDPQTGKIYHCTVGSEGFTPVELLGKELATFNQTEVHDRFRLGVLIHLLLFGDQPFKGKWIGPGDSPEPTELIRQGYWPYAPGSLIAPGPYTIPLEIVHPNLQQCFRRCFNNGHLVPTLRPTAAEWCAALQVAIAELTVCSQVSNHWYRRTCSQCHWCERKAKLGVDIFDIYSTAPAPRPKATLAPPKAKPHRGRSHLPPIYTPVLTAPQPRPSSPIQKLMLVGGILSLLSGAAISLFFVFEQPAYREVSSKRAVPVTKLLENVALTDTLTGHLNRVVAVAVSNQNRLVTSVGKDGTIIQWQLGTAERLQTLTQEAGAVNAVTFSLNQQLAAVSSEDKTIKIWDLSAGRIVRTLSGYTGRVKAIAFSPDGQLLASAGEDKLIKLWSLGTGQLLRSLGGHTAAVNALAFSPKGEILTSGGDDKKLRVWSISNGKQLYTLPEDSASVSTLAFAPNGQILASGNYNGVIKVWQLKDQRLSHTLLGDWYQVNTLAFSPNGQTLASGGEDDTIKLWNLGTGEQFRTLYGHSDWISSVTFSSNGKNLVSGSQDTTVKIWQVR